MTSMDQMDFLIEKLAGESGVYREVKPPANERDRWKLLRSLMNLRQPGPVSDDFLQVQDALLTQLAADKGTVDVAIPTVPGEPRLALWQGDITTLKIDAIVNAANSAMLGCFCGTRRITGASSAKARK